MFARPGLCGMGIGRLGLVAASRPGLVAQALVILAKYGSAANLYLPGVGAISGITAGNWLDSAGTAAAAVDGQVGRVDNARGGAHLTQSTAANRPVLRLAGGVYAWQFDGSSDHFTAAISTGSTGFICCSANFGDSGVARTLVHTGGSADAVPGVWFSKNNLNNLRLSIGDGIARNNLLSSFTVHSNQDVVLSAAWEQTKLTTGMNNSESESTYSSRNAASSNLMYLGSVTPTSNNMLGTIGATILMLTVLPTATERATLRQFIASLSGVTM